MSKGIVTQHDTICFICGRQAEAEHHLIFGTAGRELSEKDGLKVPVCNNCHNMGQKLCRIHENPMAERMSKMIGQLAWEREWLLKNTVAINSKGQMEKVDGNAVRSQFMKRYGRSYL